LGRDHNALSRPANDYVQIYAKKSNGGFILTDDGYTIDDVEQGGCKLESRRRQDLLKMTLNGFGVQLHDKSLEVHATPANFRIAQTQPRTGCARG